jgi:predicted MFS family arabinose efflux permease
MGKKNLGYIFFLLGVLSFIGNIISLIIGRRGENTTEFFEVLTAIVITILLGFIFFKYGY